MNVKNKTLFWFLFIIYLVAGLVFAVNEECRGTVQLHFFYGTAANNTVSTNITGVEDCDKFVGHLKNKDCDGPAVCSFNMLPGGGVCSFPLPTTPGEYKYAACLDMNNNGKYEENEKSLQIIKVNKDGCDSLGCVPSSWKDCACDESLKGISNGVCVDNCANEIVYQKDCTCAVPTITQNQTNGTNEQNKSENVTINQSSDTIKTENNKSDTKVQVDLTVYYPFAGALILVVVLVIAYFLITKKSIGKSQKPQKPDEPKMFGNA